MNTYELDMLIDREMDEHYTQRQIEQMLELFEDYEPEIDYLAA